METEPSDQEIARRYLFGTETLMVISRDVKKSGSCVKNYADNLRYDIVVRVAQASTRDVASFAFRFARRLTPELMLSLAKSIRGPALQAMMAAALDQLAHGKQDPADFVSRECRPLLPVVIEGSGQGPQEGGS